MAYLTNVYDIVIVSSVTTRNIKIFYNGENHDVEIDIDVPMDEICLNAYEQLSPKFKIEDNK